MTGCQSLRSRQMSNLAVHRPAVLLAQAPTQTATCARRCATAVSSRTFRPGCGCAAAKALGRTRAPGHGPTSTPPRGRAVVLVLPNERSLMLPKGKATR